MDLTERMRAICLALPEVTERLSHGEPTWFVRGKASFATLNPNGHHDLDFAFLTCAGAPGVQEELIAENPERFFRPAYVGHRGWLGIRMDGEVDWAEIKELTTDAYRLVAPKKLVAQLDA